jgi:hypothetical protein
LADTGVHLFTDPRDARGWLYEEAARRGFQSVAVEFGKEDD